MLTDMRFQASLLQPNHASSFEFLSALDLILLQNVPLISQVVLLFVPGISMHLLQSRKVRACS